MKAKDQTMGRGEVSVEGGRKKERHCRALGGTTSSVLVFLTDRLRPRENRVRERLGAVRFGVYLPWTFLLFFLFFSFFYNFPFFQSRKFFSCQSREETESKAIMAHGQGVARGWLRRDGRAAEKEKKMTARV
jgi:hypothetical protein